MDFKNKVFDTILVIAGGVQASLFDMSSNIGDQFIENPIATIIGLLTIILIIIRIRLGIKEIRKKDD